MSVLYTVLIVIIPFFSFLVYDDGKFTLIGLCAENCFFFQINKIDETKTLANINGVNFMCEFYLHSFSRLKQLTLNYQNKERSRKRKKI